MHFGGTLRDGAFVALARARSAGQILSHARRLA